MSAHVARRTDDSAWSFVYALLVHVFIVGLLLISFRWQTPPRPVVQVIQARVMQDTAVRQEVERLKQQNDRNQQRDAESARQKELQQQRQAEADKKKQLDLKKKEDEASRRAAADKKRQLAEKQRQEQQHKQAESALKEQLAAEETERTQAQAAADAVKAKGEIARHEAIIRQKVERNWQRPSSTQQGMECTVRVRLVPGGEVLQAAVIRSSGNTLFDRSAENAVYKASPLPVPQDKALFDYFREFEFKFRPEG
jgi:colicin import membrane protein